MEILKSMNFIYFQVTIQNIDVKGVSCLLYYEVGHRGKAVLVSNIPSSSFVDIEISTESLIPGETLITCKYFLVLVF